ncbi:hypothetical protein [Halomicrobium sp. LC1Hm]|uniref:hypothetical protein n=1 Tax=Halomicrobium sp. LC1Hm TaxID=2610902 RepID=UPI0012983C67|nr:hypothetical protein [Halomicrobium sp. LC1Hm]QGA81350.1 hypothetical protein LC1Hm_0284 [Halomicrobium sp. LC1Hm]
MNRRDVVAPAVSILLFTTAYLGIGWLFDWPLAGSIVVGLVGGVGFVLARRIIASSSSN